jgi:hypothetical protein
MEAVATEVMGFKPLNTSMVVSGLLMLILNLAVLGPMATSAVPDAVAEAVATKPKDDICNDLNCFDINPDWEYVTSERSFYGWSITNLDEVMTGEDPQYEKIGPVTYDVSSEREYISYDDEDGTITYRQYTIYECSETTEVACDTDITNLNIAFTPQIVGATGTAVNAIMDITKVGFSSGVMAVHLDKVSASYATSVYFQEFLSTMWEFCEMNDDLNGKACLMGNIFGLFDPVFGENFISPDSNLSYLEAGGSDPTWEGTDSENDSKVWKEVVNWTTGQLENKSFGINLDYAFEDAIGPSGEDLALLNGLGPLVYAAMGEPDSYEAIMADPANSVTMQRAILWDFAHPDDINITIARDWTFFGGIGNLVTDYGGLDETWMLDTTGESVNASQRFSNLFGLDIDNDVAMKLLFDGDGGDDPMGILATSASGTGFGLSAFDEMTPNEAKAYYGLSNNQYWPIANWTSGWLGNEHSLPLILLGGEGYITASEFVNTSFGAEDPVNGGYLDYSLNLGGLFGTSLMGGSAGMPAIDLTPEQSANILYGPLGLTTSQGAALFLYGEMSGMTPPINLTTMEPGAPVEWSTALVAQLYGVDEYAATAMRLLLIEGMFKGFIPDFLIDSFGTSPYLTMPINNWLLGWHDPVVAYLDSGDSEDMSVGWTSLESNKTYYGSGGISTGDATEYTICTGEVDTCDKGELVMQDGSTEMPWHDTTKSQATYGLIEVESIAGTTGGFITGEGDLLDLSGYGVSEVDCSSKEVLKGIPVDVCTAGIDPLERPIQAKLLDTDSLLDVTPGALPVYFGSEVTIKVEPVSGAIIAGGSESLFYLDTRPPTEQQTPPTMDDMQEVFMIVTNGEIGDSDAEALESKIVTNQDSMGYWTNFDHWIDFVTIIFYVLGLVALLGGAALVFKDESEGGVGGTVKWNSAPDPAIDLAAAAVAEDLDLEAPVETAPAMDTPAEAAPVADEPVVAEAPVEEAPVEAESTEETPAEETTEVESA